MSVYIGDGVGSMFYVGGMYNNNTHHFVTDGGDFMWLRNRTCLAESKRQLSQYSTVIIFSRDTVWSCSFHFRLDDDWIEFVCFNLYTQVTSI